MHKKENLYQSLLWNNNMGVPAQWLTVWGWEAHAYVPILSSDVSFL